MKNQSVKRVNHGQNEGDKKSKNNYYMKKELIKIMFKKNGNNEKSSQINKSKNNIYLQNNQTRNYLRTKNKEIENKYYLMKLNNLNSLEGLHPRENNSFGFNKLGKNNFTHKSNKQNILLYDQNNTQIYKYKNKKNEGNSQRPTTQPSEKKKCNRL